MPLLDLLSTFGGGAGIGEVAAVADGAAPSSPSISVSEATAQLDALLEAADEITPVIAQAVTSFVSSLLDEVFAGDAARPADLGAKAVAQLQSSVAALAGAVSPGAGQLTLISNNMNVSTEAFADTASLSAKPLRCPSSTGQEASVALPPGLMDMGDASGVDPSMPLSTLLYVMSNPLHTLDSIETQDDTAGRLRHQRLLGMQNASIRAAGPMVSFSLLQAGSELHISGASSPINISVPLEEAITPSSNLACRWWDSVAEGGNGSWSSSGCVTVIRHSSTGSRAVGRVTCSCTHLSDCEHPSPNLELASSFLSHQLVI